MQDTAPNHKPSFCEVVTLFLYLLFRVFIIICPVIAQIRVIYILCHSHNYTDSPDQCTRGLAHAELILGTYLIGYLLAIFVLFVVDNFTNESEPIKMHIAQTIVGLVVLKIYYELFVLAHALVYKQQNLFLNFIGTILLAILTAGLFLIFRYFQWSCHQLSSPTPCRRECSRFMLGFGIFYIYLLLILTATDWLAERRGFCTNLAGFSLMALLTGGVSIIVFTITFLIKHFSDDKEPIKREIARCIAGLVVFYVWWIILKTGLNIVYGAEKQKHFCELVAGHLLLAIGTGGIYLLYKPCEIIVSHWNDQDPWKRQTCRFIAGFGIFYLWYHLFYYGMKWLYNDKDSNCCYSVIGFLFLSAASMGVFIPFLVAQLIYSNWFSQNPWKRETARLLGGLIIFYLWFSLFVVGYRWVFKRSQDQQSFFYVVLGTLMLTVSTCGVYLYVLLWISGIALFKDKSNEGALSFFKVLAGFVLLSLATFGLFVPTFLILFVCDHWNSSDQSYRHIARSILGLGIFYGWYLLIIISWDAAYQDSSKTYTKILGRIGLTLATGGLYFFVMVGEYLTAICRGLNNYYFMSEEYRQAVCMLSVPTLGLFGLVTLYRSDNSCIRYPAALSLVITNAAIAFSLIYFWILPTYSDLGFTQRVLIISFFCVVSLPCAGFFNSCIIYSPAVRWLLTKLKAGFYYTWIGFTFSLAKVAYPFHILWVMFSNSMSRLWAWTRTSLSRMRCYFTNQRWIWTGSYYRVQTIVEGSPDHVAATYYEPTISQPDDWEGWDVREQKRLTSTSYLLDVKREAHQYILNAQAGFYRSIYNTVIHHHNSARVVMWRDRYNELPDSVEKRYYANKYSRNFEDPLNWRESQSAIIELQERAKAVVYQEAEYFEAIEKGEARKANMKLETELVEIKQGKKEKKKKRKVVVEVEQESQGQLNVKN